MNVAEIMNQTLADGVFISMNGAENIKIAGDEIMVNKWLPTIRDNKADILAAISPTETNCQAWTMEPPCIGKCGDSPINKQEATIPAHRRDQKRLSAVALEWLLEHRQALDAAGWTREELYTRKKYKLGLAWLPLWDEAFLLAYLHEDGTIEFECSKHGRDFFQTARPKNIRGSNDERH